MLSRYRTFLALPDTSSMVLTAFLTRMPIGMTSLAILMLLRNELGSFKLAGLAVGAQHIAMAITAPIQGRIMDRIGPKLVLLITGVMLPLMSLLLLLVAITKQSNWIILLCATLIGLFQTPISVLTRMVWRYRFEHDHERRVAFAIDSILIEMNFIIGPTIIAGLIAFANARIAFVIMIGTIIMSSIIFHFSSVLKYWRMEVHTDRRLMGPLTLPDLRIIYVITLGMAFGFGVLEVGYPGYADHIGKPAYSGVLLSLSCIGSAIGGAVYGGMHLKQSLQRQLTIALGLISIPLFLHYQVDSVIGFSIIAFFAGAAIAPALTATTLLVARYAPDKYATEAFTWSTSCIVTGVGAGMAVSGILIESVSIKAPFLVGALVVILTSVFALYCKLTPHRDH